MGLGKYLMDKLEESMTGKGVLQVDKVEGKSGNFVHERPLRWSLQQAVRLRVARLPHDHLRVRARQADLQDHCPQEAGQVLRARSRVGGQLENSPVAVHSSLPSEQQTAQWSYVNFF